MKPVTRLPVSDADRAGPSGRGDAELVALCARGDLRALGELYERHAKHVFRVVDRVTRGSGDVDDIVQATFLKLPEIAKTFDGRDSARAWLAGIGARLALRHMRSAARFARMLEGFARTRTGLAEGSPEAKAHDNQRLAAFEAALGELSPKLRAVFVLVELDGMAQEMAAEVLEVPPVTVRTRLFKARQELKKSMKRAGV